MSRDAASRAKAVDDRAIGLSKTYGAKGDGLADQLTGIYGQQATNPQGMSRGDLNDANTASMQSTGGSVAGVKGEGVLDASRTGNVGAYQSNLRDAARRGIIANSNNGLKTNLINTTLKEQQREQGVSGLQGLQTADQRDSIGALNPAVSAVNAQNSASPGWFQNMTSLIEAVSGAGKAASSLGVKV